jgi:1-acylglycerone phosphate reductase
MSSKSVLITGCSRGGIGSELAFAFQKAGLTVFATARNTGKIDPALVKLQNVEVLELDVASSASISAAAKAIDSRLHGRLDILVNNSGVGVPGPIAEIQLEEAKKMFDVNLWGVLEVTQAFTPLLIRSKGVVVNNSSVGGFIHMPFNGEYAFKFGATMSLIGAQRRLWSIQSCCRDN